MTSRFITQGHLVITIDRAARLATEILAPWVWIIALPLLVLGHAIDLGPALGWGLLLGLTNSVLPMAVIVWGARTGRWDGHHVRNRAGRLIPFIALVGFSGLGLLLLWALRAPAVALHLNIVMLILLGVTSAITIGARWKISIHAATAAGAIAALTAVVSPWWLLGSPAVAAVAWSRVHLRDHTLAQVLAGSAVGALVLGLL